MIRLDLYLSNYGYVKSRQRAKALIEDGHVMLNSKKITKPSFLVDEDAENVIEISDPCPYVSRGGLKLKKAIELANIDVLDKVVLDIGASTGGFTDCLLKHGARRVFAVDSGTNQLDPSLVRNDKVVSLENYNARNISLNDIGELCDIVTIDVSFISQTYILPSAVKLLKPSGVYVSLIKPQFEVGKDKIGKGGIVKQAKDRALAVHRVFDCATENGLSCICFDKSPILGGDGNVEYLAVFAKDTKSIISYDSINEFILKN